MLRERLRGGKGRKELIRREGICWRKRREEKSEEGKDEGMKTEGEKG